MRLVDVLCCILWILLVVLLAILVVRGLGGAPRQIAVGGYEVPLNLDDVVYSSYRVLKEYIDGISAGDTKDFIDPVGNIERYLSTLYGVKSIEVPEDIKNDSSIEHKKLYALVQKIIREHKPVDKHGFIYNSGICFLRFVPKEIGDKIRDSYKHEIFDKGEVKYMLENAISPLTLYGEQMDHWMDRLRVMSRMYHKYKTSSLKSALKKAKKKADVAKALPTAEDSFELDTPAFLALINQFAREIKLRRDLEKARAEGIREGEKNMAQRLGSIDLITAWRQDPYLVRRFIERIKREIREIEARRDFRSVVDPFSKSLYDDLIEEERKEQELRRARERQIRRDLERERLEKERIRRHLTEERGVLPGRGTPPRIPTPGDKSGLAKPKGPYEVPEIPPFRGHRAVEFPPKGERSMTSAPFG